MATATVGSRTQVVARATADRSTLRGFLERDRLLAAYAICDLDDREFGRTKWGVASLGEHLVAVGVEYSGPTPQPMFLMGSNDGIAAILRDVLRPRAAYVAVTTPAIPTVAQLYRVEPGPPMIRMHVDRATFRPHPAAVERLLPGAVGELNRLYQLGFAAWLPAGSIAEGVYFGIRSGGRLVAAAGTHVVSREGRIGVVGNVMTHADHRNRGHAKAVTAAVTAELLRTCEDVVLNVRSDNPPAIAAYRGLGYEEHCRFEERLARRTASSWPSFTAPLRRLFAIRGTADAGPIGLDQAHPNGVDQAHPIAPLADPAPDTSAGDGDTPAGHPPGAPDEEPR